MENPGSGREGPGALRRRWSDAEKRRIVAESYQPGVSVSVVARRNDVNANLVFNWRRRFREQAGGAGGLVPVVVEPPPLGAAAGDAPAAGRMEIHGGMARQLPALGLYPALEIGQHRRAQLLAQTLRRQHMRRDPCSGRSATVQAPTWSARVDRLRSTPSRA